MKRLLKVFVLISLALVPCSRAISGQLTSIAAYPRLDWPLEYPLNNGSLIGSYVDEDASTPGYRDYSNGEHTYDGHNGTDCDVFDFRAMDRGVAVLAAADGVVDSEEFSKFDRNTQWPRNDPLPNDILIRHAEGGYTWYVHLRKNSITVAPGETVRRGQLIGFVGSSGSSTLPHLHFEPGEYIGNNWNWRDPFQGPRQSQSSLWRSQEPYVVTAPIRIADIGVFTRAAAGGSMTNIPDATLKERLSQPAVFGITEPSIGAWVLVQGKKGQTYTVELRRPDGAVFNTKNYTLTDYQLQDWEYVSWNFAGSVTAADFGTWTVRALIGESVAVQSSFEVGAATAYPPRFSVSGRSLRVTGSAQQDRLVMSSLTGSVTYSLVNAPSTVSLRTDQVTIGATSSQPYRSAFFQVVATDAAGRQDTMWYHLIDPSKPFPNDSIRGFLDNLDGTTVGGDVTIRGWSAIVGGGRARKAARIDLYVDDHFAARLTPGDSRPDVQQTLGAEGFTGSADLGFTGTWDSRQVSAGTHRLTLRAGDQEAGRFDFLTQSTVTVVVDQNAAAGTSTSFNLSDRAGLSSITVAASGTPTVGYARIQAGAGSTMPSGFSIFSLRQNNMLVTEASVPAAPAMQTGRIYAEVNGPVDTGFAIANPGSQPAVISFQFVDASGTEVRQASTTLAAGAQLAAFLDQAPFNSGTFTGTVTFSSSVAVSAIALRGLTNQRSEFLITTLPVVPVGTTSSDTLVVPHLADGGGWTTQVVLINPGNTPLSGTVDFFTPGTSTANGAPWTLVIDGQSTNRVSYVLPARGEKTFKTSGSGAATSVGWARIVPAAGSTSPIGTALFSYKPADVTVSETSVAAMRTGSAFRLYVESSGNFNSSAPGSIESGLAIANPGSSTATVTYELTKLDGTSTGLTGSLAVPAAGQIATFLRQLPAVTSLQTPFQGILRISSSSALATIGLRARYNEQTRFLLATTPPANESVVETAQELFFPHLVVSGGYTTQFVLFNPTPSSEAGLLSFFTQSGQPMVIPFQR